MAKTEAPNPGTELDVNLRAEIDAATPGFKTMDDVVAFFEGKGVNLFDNATDGVKSLDLLDDKEILIGVPLAILQWRFNESDKYKDADGQSGVFVSAEVQFMVSRDTGEPLKTVIKDKNGDPLYDLRTVVLNDGGTGIAAQLATITANRKSAGLSNTHVGRGVRKGLRVSRYDYTDSETGKTSEAETYYLDF